MSMGGAGTNARAIEIVEVAPRDGLQNEAGIVSTSDKLRLIEHAIDAGVRRIEVASFVHPDRVPQMADAEAVIAALPDRPDVTYIGLVLNKRGLHRALETRVDEVGAVCVASDTLGQKNQGQDSRASLEIATDIVRFARREGKGAQITIAAAFGCPFEGEVDPAHVLEMALAAAEAGPREVALADTIGVAVPADVSLLVSKVREAIAPIPIRVHFHNTRNTGVANVWAAVEAGARTVDASLGGLGGCPFAPGAAGNVPTEDVIYMLQRSGIETGLDLEKLIKATNWFSEIMGRPLPAMVSKAGSFPANRAQREG